MPEHSTFKLLSYNMTEHVHHITLGLCHQQHLLSLSLALGMSLSATMHSLSKRANSGHANSLQLDTNRPNSRRKTKMQAK